MTSGGASAAARDFVFTPRDFERVRKLIYAKAGISLGEQKQEMVYSRLARRLRAHGLTSFQRYLDLLENNDKAEWEEFTNALTTNLTSFSARLITRHAGRAPDGWAAQRRLRHLVRWRHRLGGGIFTGDDPGRDLLHLDARGGECSQPISTRWR